jgi:hypothetical protein
LARKCDWFVRVPGPAWPRVDLLGHHAALDAQDTRRRLPGVIAGEGVLESTLGGYQPVRGAPAAATPHDRRPRNR